MNAFEAELDARLVGLSAQGLHRRVCRVDSAQGPRLVIDGKVLLNFGSNDYLGLANHAALREAAIAAVERYGAGSGASRLICGSLAPHQELEERLAEFKTTEAALAFSTGYAAAVGAICALMKTGDIVIVDKRVHACVVDAARLCGATLRVFRHNDLNHLEHLLLWAVQQRSINSRTADGSKPQILLVTESVFSMDGDHAPLRDIVRLKNQHGAWLMIDEAHATGLYGKNRRGLAEELGIAAEVEIQMGTLGKAAGAAGGYICGSRKLIDYLVNRARSFIFSTAPVPAAAASAAAGIRLIQSSVGEELRAALWRRVSALTAILPRKGSPCLSAIVPIQMGKETLAVETAAALRQHGIFIPAIRYPTVARGRARLRLTMTAAHTEADLADLRSVLQNLHIGPPS